MSEEATIAALLGWLPPRGAQELRRERDAAIKERDEAQAKAAVSEVEMSVNIQLGKRVQALEAHIKVLRDALLRCRPAMLTGPMFIDIEALRKLIDTALSSDVGKED